MPSDGLAGVAPRSGNVEALCDSDFESDVLRRLVERGYRVTPQVGARGYRSTWSSKGSTGAVSRSSATRTGIIGWSAGRTTCAVSASWSA